MKPQRPYLLRALYEWIIDSDEIPYLLVDATVEGVSVPEAHVQDGQIVLNMSPNAVRDLVMDDAFVMCSGRFSGQHFELYLPMNSIRAIYAKDTREGMVFPEEEALTVGPTEADQRRNNSDAPPDNKPGLRLV
ncbi:MAG: ClpXP protease specificity-enhancing factor [Pseudomonadaceae bacterium]|nr:ClpXP protease specificity-enhancing factor [Pseudomonadaceae bacterium]